MSVVRHDHDAAAAVVTVADDVHSGLLEDLLGCVAGCFPRRETRQSCRQMVAGLLMELEDHNCWTIAEAAGHRGPHRLQHLLSRAVWDERQALDAARMEVVRFLPPEVTKRSRRLAKAISSWPSTSRWPPR